MTRIKTRISYTLRRLGLLQIFDWLHFNVERIRNQKKNSAFVQQYPEVPLPPDYLIYESFQLNYHKYFVESKNTAEWLTELFAKYIELRDLTILDWGCGPGRIIQHLPKVIGNE